MNAIEDMPVLTQRNFEGFNSRVEHSSVIRISGVLEYILKEDN